MTDISLPKTRQELQIEAMHVQSLLSAAMGYDDPSDNEKVACLMTMAWDHANRLNAALDSVNTPEVQS